jgi:hypothetical protein
VISTLQSTLCQTVGELLIPGLVLSESMRPISLEVDGVEEVHHRIGWDRVDHSLDLSFGGLVYPPV